MMFNLGDGYSLLWVAFTQTRAGAPMEVPEGPVGNVVRSRPENNVNGDLCIIQQIQDVVIH